MVWRAITSDGLPPGFLRACLLLLLAERQAHGYRLCDDLSDFEIDMDSGTVYRHLRAMEDEGLAVSHWELSDAGPPRRTYTLTEDGLRQLEVSSAAIRGIVGLLREYVQRSEAVGDQLREESVLVLDEQEART